MAGEPLLVGQPELALLREDGLPLAGRTGTLKASYGRFVTADSRCAQGRVHAKTGTLGDVAALAGWTKGTDGRVKAFAFVVNGKKADLTLKRKLDMLTASQATVTSPSRHLAGTPSTGHPCDLTLRTAPTKRWRGP